MASANYVMIMGNLTRDVDLRTLPSGKKVAEFGVAMNEEYTSRTGEKVERVCFVDVVVWERQAETCAQYISKGSPVLIEGRLQLDQWEKDGEKRSKLRIRADRVQFIGPPRRNNEYADGPAAGARPAAPGAPAASAEADPFQ